MLDDTVLFDSMETIASDATAQVSNTASTPQCQHQQAEHLQHQQQSSTNPTLLQQILCEIYFISEHCKSTGVIVYAKFPSHLQLMTILFPNVTFYVFEANDQEIPFSNTFMFNEHLTVKFAQHLTASLEEAVEEKDPEAEQLLEQALQETTTRLVAFINNSVPNGNNNNHNNNLFEWQLNVHYALRASASLLKMNMNSCYTASSSSYNSATTTSTTTMSSLVMNIGHGESFVILDHDGKLKCAGKWANLLHQYHNATSANKKLSSTTSVTVVADNGALIKHVIVHYMNSNNLTASYSAAADFEDQHDYNDYCQQQQQEKELIMHHLYNQIIVFTQ